MRTQMNKTLSNIRNNKAAEFLFSFGGEINACRIKESSAALAFYALLALAPILVFVIMISSLVVDQQSFQHQVADYFGEHFGMEEGLISGIVENAFDLLGNWFVTLVALMVMLFSVVGVVNQARQTFFTIFRLELSGNKITRTLKRYLLSVIYTFLVGVVVLLLAAFNFILSFLVRFLGGLERELISGFGLEIVNAGVWWVVFTGVFFLIYRFMSMGKLDNSSMLQGAAGAGLCLMALNMLISVYASYSVTLSIYDALTSIMVLMLWVYFLFFILFAGAIVARLRAQVRDPAVSYSDSI